MSCTGFTGMSKERAPLRPGQPGLRVAAGQYLLIAAILTIGATAAFGQNDPNQDAWPGHSPGGLYFRSLDWGVTFWGPAGADQQLESAISSVLVRYSVPIVAGRSAWALTVLAGKSTADLSAEELLAQTVNQLRRVLGNRLADLKAGAIKPDESPSPLAIARLTCTVSGERSGGAIHRHYLYLRLRAKQYLTFMAEGPTTSADSIARTVDQLARSLRAVDPDEQKKQIEDAAKRTAELLGQLTSADWDDAVRKSGPRWARLWTRSDGKPEPVGWAYAATAGKGAGRVESVMSVRTQAGFAAYRSADINLATGEEMVREWTRAPGKSGPMDMTFIARRRGGGEARGTAAGSDTFNITVQAAGRPEKTFTAKIPANPYLPVALQDLLCQKLTGRGDSLFGAFTLSADKVVFTTFQQTGTKLDSAGGPAQATRWLIRPTVSEPMTVRLTDASGATVLRVDTQPEAWSERAEESDVPAEVRRELTTQPKW